MTFNGRQIKGKLHKMSFRTAIDNTEDLTKAFIANHPNIDILSITTSFYSVTYGVTTIWYTEVSKFCQTI